MSVFEYIKRRSDSPVFPTYGEGTNSWRDGIYVAPREWGTEMRPPTLNLLAEYLKSNANTKPTPMPGATSGWEALNSAWSTPPTTESATFKLPLILKLPKRSKPTTTKGATTKGDTSESILNQLTRGEISLSEAYSKLQNMDTQELLKLREMVVKEKSGLTGTKNKTYDKYSWLGGLANWAREFEKSHGGEGPEEYYENSPLARMGVMSPIEEANWDRMWGEQFMRTYGRPPSDYDWADSYYHRRAMKLAGANPWGG